MSTEPTVDRTRWGYRNTDFIRNVCSHICDEASSIVGTANRVRFRHGGTTHVWFVCENCGEAITEAEKRSLLDERREKC